MNRYRGLGILGVLLLVLMLGSSFAFAQAFNVAVYFPGVLGGNPLEPAITSGVERVEQNFEAVNVKVIEGGAPSDWESGITTLAATGAWDLIITFTDGMPQILATVSQQFPEQKFALLDSSAPDLESVYSLVYSDEALGFLGGAFAGLVATSEELNADSANPAIGILAGTPYPAMDNKIFPGYKAGAHYVDPAVDVRFAAVGSWNDPTKARDLGLNMFDRGIAIIFSITGGGDSGIQKAAEEAGRYVIAVNTNQNSLAPGVILTSVLKRIDNSIVDVVGRALAGELPYGSVEAAGIEQGAIGLAQDSLYEENVPSAIRAKLDEIVQAIASGDIDLDKRIQAERGN